MTLAAAHKGYEYQDIYSAYIILKAFREFKDFNFLVDYKEHDRDTFDDLTIIAPRQKIKFQIRHSADSVLSARDFIGSGKFSLNNFAQSFVKTSIPTKYVLATTRGLDTKNKSFVQIPSRSNLLSSNVWRIDPKTLPCNDSYFLKAFVVDADLPSISSDFQSPGKLESLLFDYLKQEIGVGGYPNDSLSPEIFADGLCRLVRSIRSGSVKQPISKTVLINLFQSSGLKVDYGHIAQQFPLVADERRLHFKNLQDELKKECLRSPSVLLVGLPGSGKSHQFDSLFDALSKDEEVIAVQYYCYLEPTDDLVLERINVNRMFGNIVYQLANKFPEIAEKMPRLYAADRIKIEEFAKIVVEKENKRIVVMIDGLDHLERVINQKGGLSPAIANKFIEELIRLKLPENSCLVISSQPGAHLRSFNEQKNVKIIEIPAWKELDISQYLLKEGLPQEIIEERRRDESFLSRICLISEGNPLYLNYLTKEIKEKMSSCKDKWSVVTDLPQLHSNINKYYGYLMHTIREADIAIAETVALLDFSITSDQLGKIFPAIDRRRVMNVLKQLGPVLQDSFSIGGFRIYHESFRRYILKNASKRRISKKDLYSHIIDWLVGQDFFKSTIAYNYLFSYLRRGRQEARIFEFITKDFLTDSLSELHPVNSISDNIALAADVAANKCDWAILAQLTQINKALYTYSELDYLHEELSDCYLKVFGHNAFSKRMVLNGKRNFPLIQGFQYCHHIAKSGGDAPWAAYDLSNLSISVDSEDKKILCQNLESGVFYRKILGKDLPQAFKQLFTHLRKHQNINDQRRVDLLVEQIFLQHKPESVIDIFFKSEWISKCNTKALIAFSSYIKDKPVYVKRLSAVLALKKQPLPPADLNRLVNAGISPRPFIDDKTIFEQFKQCSKSVIETKYLYDRGLANFENWYCLLQILAVVKPSALKETRNQIRPDGWYRAWLVFLIDLSLAERNSSAKEKETKILQSLEALSFFQEPFRGEPRACDLYSVRHLTEDSFLRTVETIQLDVSVNIMIPLLEKISTGTTTTLQRSPGGPLTEQVLSKIYTQSLPRKTAEVKELLKKAVLDQLQKIKSHGRFYEIQASESFQTAHVLMEVGEKSNARKIFRQGCHYSYSYGMRKDITLWDIIEPIPSFYRQDRTFAIKAFQKTYLLPKIVTIHTDGAETKWALSRWYESLFDSDLSLGIRFLTNDIKLNYLDRDWRIEIICEDLANRLVGKINPVLVSGLYKSLKMDDFDRTDFEPRLLLLEDFYTKGLPADDYVCDLSYWLMVWCYPTTDKKPYIKVINKFFALQRKYKFSLSAYVVEALKQKVNDSKTRNDPSFKKGSVETKIKKRVFEKSMDADQIRLAMEGSSIDDLSQPGNIRIFSNLIMKIADKGETLEASALIVDYARRSHVSGPLKSLEDIGDILLKGGWKDLAAEAYAIGFFYSRGGHGWLILGDESSYPMAKKSTSISKKIFHSILARETAQAIEKPVYFTGGNQHLAEVFCNVTNELAIAEKIWDGSFTIINHRLPSMKNMGLKMPATLSLPMKRFDIKNEITFLVKQRSKITTRY